MVVVHWQSPKRVVEVGEVKCQKEGDSKVQKVLKPNIQKIEAA